MYAQFAVDAKRPYFINKTNHILFRQRLYADGYYSQDGQDKWIAEELFPRKEKGTFVDIGAHDGINFSNTYHLEQKGWRGIAIEPNPAVYKKLAENRKCITIQGCIAPSSGKKKFRYITGYAEMLSGLVDEYDSRHAARIEAEVKSKGGGYQDIEVTCYNLNELLEQYGLYEVDYINIDVEGAEYRILRSINYKRCHFSFIGVENNYRDWRIPSFLTRKGFRFHSIVGDEFYQNKVML